MMPAQFARYEVPTCRNCGVFVPEVMVPWDAGAIPMCWICAHLVTAHDHPLGEPVEHCGCSGEDVYPPDVLARRRAACEVEMSGEIVIPDVLPVEDRSQIPWAQRTVDPKASAAQDATEHVVRGREARRERVTRMQMRSLADGGES